MSEPDSEFVSCKTRRRLTPHCIVMKALRCYAIPVLTWLALSLGSSARAQPGRDRFPVRPHGLPEAEEVELAMSAAPAEISSRADIYVLRDTAFIKARRGTNGCACMVSRDLHGGKPVSHVLRRRGGENVDAEGNSRNVFACEGTFGGRGEALRRGGDEQRRVADAKEAGRFLHDVAQAGAFLIAKRRWRSRGRLVASPHGVRTWRHATTARARSAVSDRGLFVQRRASGSSRVDRESSGLVRRDAGRRTTTTVTQLFRLTLLRLARRPTGCTRVQITDTSPRRAHDPLRAQHPARHSSRPSGSSAFRSNTSEESP